MEELARRLVSEGPSKALPTPRLVRGLLNGKYIFRTTKAKLIWEVPFYPQLYIPATDLSKEYVEVGKAINAPDGSCIGHHLMIKVGDRTTDKAVQFSDSLNDKAAELNGMVKIQFDALDHWFEEDTPIYVHPKDPYKRVDILASTRPLRVSVDGCVVAETTTSMHLYETGLPPRYYIPLTSIKPEVLRPSQTRTRCPYKGEAEYYSVEIDGKLNKDIVWYYRHPLLECVRLEGFCCFYNEKVDIELDGELLERPTKR